MPDPDAVRAACRRIEAAVRADHRYAHTSHLRVHVDGRPVVDEHYRGPAVADVFSVTKTVVATVAGIAARRGLLPDLDDPVAVLDGTPAQGQTWRQLLTMTRGAAVDGAWDVDAVTALPGGQVAHIAAAPILEPPGRTFRYDNGASHLLSAALGQVLGRPVADVAQAALFAPLGIADADWLADPDGVTYGFAHLRLSAESLGTLGEFWRRRGEPLVDPAFAAAMFAPQSAGGSPADRAYGFHVWIDDDLALALGWGGQCVLVAPDAVVVMTGDTGFQPGPPARDELPPDWRPGLELVREHLLPVLR